MTLGDTAPRAGPAGSCCALRRSKGPSREVGLPGFCCSDPDSSGLGPHVGPSAPSLAHGLSKPRALSMASRTQVTLGWLLCHPDTLLRGLHSVTSDTHLRHAPNPLTPRLKHKGHIWALISQIHQGLGLLALSDSAIPLLSQQSGAAGISIPISRARHRAPCH